MATVADSDGQSILDHVSSGELSLLRMTRHKDYSIPGCSRQQVWSFGVVGRVSPKIPN